MKEAKPYSELNLTDRAVTAEGREASEKARLAAEVEWGETRISRPTYSEIAAFRDGYRAILARAEAAEIRLTSADQQAQALMRQGLVLQEEITRLREKLAVASAALETIRDGDVLRPVDLPWFPDGRPSKHDRCPHAVLMYEDCGECISEFAAQALGRGK